MGLTTGARGTPVRGGEGGVLVRPPGRVPAVAEPPPAPPEAPIIDVWSRTAPKYRVRAVVLLSLSAVLFGCFACFAFWLREGVFWAPGLDDYWMRWWAAFDPMAEQQVTLTDMLLRPIHVRQVPLMVVIIGLVHATLISIPILVAILYRLPCALPFVAMVAFLAVMPWLAANLVLATAIASNRRITFRFASAMIALVPVVIYFALATQDSSRSIQPLSPAEQVMVYAPWALALVASALLMGAVLALARVVNYRPGAIPPMLVLMFIIPVVLFETQVGRDELYYRLLESAYSPRVEGVFPQRTPREVLSAILEGRGERSGDLPEEVEPADLWLAAPGIQQRLEEQYNETLAEFLTVRERIVRACRWFVQQYPSSRYVPNALYLQASALDARLDRAAFLREGRTRYYRDFPAAVSRAVWTRLLTGAPRSLPAGVARLRLALLRAREGDVPGALALLDELIESPPQPPPPDGERDRGWRALFHRQPRAATLGLSPAVMVAEARRLRELLASNRDGPETYGDAPLIEWLRCDPHHPRYTENLRALRERYPDSRIVDNIEVELALASDWTILRVGQLAACVERYPDGDAAPRALFALGQIYQEGRQLATAAAKYRAVIERYPDSVWADEARERLEQLRRVAGPLELEPPAG